MRKKQLLGLAAALSVLGLAAEASATTLLEGATVHVAITGTPDFPTPVSLLDGSANPVPSGNFTIANDLTTDTVAFAPGTGVSINLFGDHFSIFSFGPFFGFPLDTFHIDITNLPTDVEIAGFGTTPAFTFSGGDFHTDIPASCCGSNSVWAVSAATTAGVPEPASWALMLLGFAAIGLGARRDRKITATA